MPPKKQKTLDPPPASSSEDEIDSGEEVEEEEVESGEEEVESGEEEAGGEGQDQEEDEGDSECDEQDEEEESESVSKTVEKPRSSTSPAVVPVSQKQKLPAQSENGGGSSSQPGNEKTEPRKLFGRVWSDHDVTELLKGLQGWHDKGDNPYANLGGFLESIQESLHASVNVEQLFHKIKKLKKKYRNNFKRGKGGKDPKFSKPHESNCYQIMKVIWVGEEVSGRNRKRRAPAGNCNDESASTSNGKRSRRSKSKTTLVSPTQNTVGLSAYPTLAAWFLDVKNLPVVGESLLKQGFGFLGDKAKELQEKLSKLQEEEEEVYLKRVDLIQEVTAALVNGIKSSDS